MSICVTPDASMIRCRSHPTPAFTTSLSLTDQRSCRYGVVIWCSGGARGAGRAEVLRGVWVLVAAAGRRGGPDGVALFVPRGLRSDHPLRCDRPFVTQRVIASAEILPAEISARLAVEGVVVVVDRAGIGA